MASLALVTLTANGADTEIHPDVFPAASGSPPGGSVADGASAVDVGVFVSTPRDSLGCGAVLAAFPLICGQSHAAPTPAIATTAIAAAPGTHFAVLRRVTLAPSVSANNDWRSASYGSASFAPALW